MLQKARVSITNCHWLLLYPIKSCQDNVVNIQPFPFTLPTFLVYLLWHLTPYVPGESVKPVSRLYGSFCFARVGRRAIWLYFFINSTFIDTLVLVVLVTFSTSIT